MFHIQLYLTVCLHKCGYLSLFGAFLRYLGMQCLYGWRYQLWRGANQCCVLLLQLCSRYELFISSSHGCVGTPVSAKSPLALMS